MDKIIYKMNNITTTFLINKGFKYSKYLSDTIDDIYAYKFPLITYKKSVTIECEIAVSTMTGIVNVNVYNAGTKELYVPYYDREFGSYRIIRTIDQKIEKKLKELGIEDI